MSNCAATSSNNRSRSGGVARRVREGRGHSVSFVPTATAVTFAFWPCQRFCSPCRLALVVEQLDGRELLAFEHRQAGAAAGADVGDLVG